MHPMSHLCWRISQGGCLHFLIGFKKHKIVRGYWVFEICKVLLNSLQQFQRRSKKCLSQSEARTASCFTDWSEKHKLGRGCWSLASCQVSLNSVQWLQRSRKRLGKSEANAAILVFQWTQNPKSGRRCSVLSPCKVSLNSVQLLQRRSIKCLGKSEVRVVIFGGGGKRQYLLPVNFIKFHSEKKSKMSQLIRRQEGHLFFLLISPKNKLVKDVEFLLPVKFCWIPYSNFREEVENVKS